MQSILVWNMLTYLSFVLGVLLADTGNSWAQNTHVDNRFNRPSTQHTGVTIHDRVIGYNMYHTKTPRTHIDGGPTAGDTLNGHYFPGLQDYSNGFYSSAEGELSFNINNSRHLDKNPRKNEYLSNAYYVRGLIYFYHASGRERLTFAKEDFENSIRWNPRNSLPYFELARLLSSLELRAEATSVLQRLSALPLGEQVAQKVQAELSRLQSKKP